MSRHLFLHCTQYFKCIGARSITCCAAGLLVYTRRIRPKWNSSITSLAAGNTRVSSELHSKSENALESVFSGRVKMVNTAQKCVLVDRRRSLYTMRSKNLIAEWRYDKGYPLPMDLAKFASRMRVNTRAIRHWSIRKDFAQAAYDMLELLRAGHNVFLSFGLDI